MAVVRAERSADIEEKLNNFGILQPCLSGNTSWQERADQKEEELPRKEIERFGELAAQAIGSAYGGGERMTAKQSPVLESPAMLYGSTAAIDRKVSAESHWWARELGGASVTSGGQGRCHRSENRVPRLLVYRPGQFCGLCEAISRVPVGKSLLRARTFLARSAG